MDPKPERSTRGPAAKPGRSRTRSPRRMLGRRRTGDVPPPARRRKSSAESHGTREDPSPGPRPGPPPGLAPIAPLLTDNRITEILINGPGPVWAEIDGGLHRSTSSVTAHQIELLIEHLLAPLGLRVDRTAPIVDARLADGSRVNIVVPPLAIGGPALSIRRFPSHPPDLSAFGPPILADLLGRLVRARASILVVGNTSSGKTSLIDALTALLEPAERVVCIEDTAELAARGPQIVRLEARPPNSEGVGAVPLRQLVQTALRMRPDRIIVGEVRGSEAFDLLLALTSGHQGCLTSCHAPDAAAGLRRLETLAMLAATGVEAGPVRRMIVDGLDAVITTRRDGPCRSVVAVHRLTENGLEPLWPATDPSATPTDGGGRTPC